MRRFLRVFGWLLLVLGLSLCLLGIASLPTGGLMFALPFFFFIPGFVLLVGGGILLFFTRLKVSSSPEVKDASQQL